MNPKNQNIIKIGLHHAPMVVARNQFLYKSLSSWVVNGFMGCLHGCCVCYVPETSVSKQEMLLGAYGVSKPVAEWGNYLLVRPLYEDVFVKSVVAADNTMLSDLNPDGNLAVMFSSTTDPYQVIRHPNPETNKLFNGLARFNMRRSLELIRDHSSLNVRILTRSPLARDDFELFQSFGNRLLLGISLPTLDDKLSRIYEPQSPPPTKRLKMLVDAHKAGIPTFVAVAPVYPNIGFDGMLEVFNAVKEAHPFTIFMEPVNIRLGVHDRIKAEAEKNDRTVDLSPFSSEGTTWSDYAINTLLDAERAAEAAGVRDRLHLWPDHDALGSVAVRNAQTKVWNHPSGKSYPEWLDHWWNRISEWPGKAAG